VLSEAAARAYEVAMDLFAASPAKHSIAIGIVCGAGSALFWALGFVAARHGILVGLSPLALSLHRFIWPGVALMPLVLADGIGDLGGIGWGRGIVLTLFGGLPLALWSYFGYVYVPLGHGAVIQPSCAAVGGLILARLLLGERLPPRRIAGAVTIVIGLGVIGTEALRTMGETGVFGDLLFVAAGSSFAVTGVLLRRWRLAPTRAAAVTSVLSLVGLPLLWFCYDNMLAAGWRENLLQAVVQGVFAGPGALYLFTRAVVLLGAGRAVVFPSLVPPFTLLIGFVALGEVPSLVQLAGLVVVIVGFQMTQ
jgi:drug/metabolite transporter (DMT)-like permease